MDGAAAHEHDHPTDAAAAGEAVHDAALAKALRQMKSWAHLLRKEPSFDGVMGKMIKAAKAGCEAGDPRHGLLLRRISEAAKVLEGMSVRPTRERVRALFSACEAFQRHCHPSAEQRHKLTAILGHPTLAGLLDASPSDANDPAAAGAAHAVGTTSAAEALSMHLSDRAAFVVQAGGLVLKLLQRDSPELAQGLHTLHQALGLLKAADAGVREFPAVLARLWDAMEEVVRCVLQQGPADGAHFQVDAMLQAAFVLDSLEIMAGGAGCPVHQIRRLQQWRRDATLRLVALGCSARGGGPATHVLEAVTATMRSVHAVNARQASAGDASDLGMEERDVAALEDAVDSASFAFTGAQLKSLHDTLVTCANRYTKTGTVPAALVQRVRVLLRHTKLLALLPPKLARAQHAAAAKLEKAHPERPGGQRDAAVAAAAAPEEAEGDEAATEAAAAEQAPADPDPDPVSVDAKLLNTQRRLWGSLYTFANAPGATAATLQRALTALEHALPERDVMLVAVLTSLENALVLPAILSVTDLVAEASATEAAAQVLCQWRGLLLQALNVQDASAAPHHRFTTRMEQALGLSLAATQARMRAFGIAGWPLTPHHAAALANARALLEVAQDRLGALQEAVAGGEVHAETAQQLQEVTAMFSDLMPESQWQRLVACALQLARKACRLPPQQTELRHSAAEALQLLEGLHERFGQSKADGAQLRQAQHRLRAGDAADDDTGDDADAAEEADDADAAVDAAADADAAPAAAAALAEAAAAAATAISSVRALELLPLDRALSLLYIDLLPSDREEGAKEALLMRLRRTITGRFRHAALHLYGSSASLFGGSSSDVDICLVMPTASAAQEVWRLKGLLAGAGYLDLFAVPAARVPVVKLKDPISGFCCDICINNTLALHNTQMLRTYALIDERVRQLVFVIKHWAKQRRINSPPMGTLSSYAYALLCIFYLQTSVQPPVLPNLQDPALLERFGVQPNIVEDRDATFLSDPDAARATLEERNVQSVPELLAGFFAFFNKLFKQPDSYPFDRSHDLGKVLSEAGTKALKEELSRAVALSAAGKYDELFELAPDRTNLKPVWQRRGPPRRRSKANP